MSTRIAVDLEMATCVRGMNGIVLDDVLEQPDFYNADYWFPESNVVVELKCLSEDLSSNSAFNQVVSNLYASWVKRGLVPRPTAAKTRVNLRDLPLKCAREFLDPIKRKLETSTIRKAKQQIRETKKYFGAPDAKGLLLLANDGNYMLPPSMMMDLLWRILQTQHSSISSVIYFSVNEVASVPGIDMPCTFWTDAVVPEREPVALEFRRQLQEAWMRHYSTLVPEPVFEFRGSSTPDFVDNIQLIRGNGA